MREVNTVKKIRGPGAWHRALAQTFLLLPVMLALSHYWSAVADRYRIFLCFHEMGPLVPDTSPFSLVTRSRYWKAGLVASGLVMVLYGSANWVWGRPVPHDEPPAWRRVWLYTAVPLAPGIMRVAMTANEPRLPPWPAVQMALVTVAGLGLALVPGQMAARPAPRRYSRQDCVSPTCFCRPCTICHSPAAITTSATARISSPIAGWCSSRPGPWREVLRWGCRDPATICCAEQAARQRAQERVYD